jgi:hypothetical protein
LLFCQLTGLVGLPTQWEFTPKESKVPAGNGWWLIWRAQKDDFRSFLGGFVAALPQIDFPGLSVLANAMPSKRESTEVAQGAAVN